MKNIQTQIISANTHVIQKKNKIIRDSPIIKIEVNIFQNIKKIMIDVQ